MPKKFDKLDEVFNVTGEIVSDQIESTEIELVEEKKEMNPINDTKKDYDYVRGNMYSIVEKGQEALNSALELAQETDSPRAYEVVGQLIKNVSDSAEKLIELHKKMKDIEEVKHSNGPTNVTNALFVGSTAELSKLLKGKLNTTEDK
jgi:5-bromo-4-chloroindolyl phosphate hydrolysis protein